MYVLEFGVQLLFVCAVSLANSCVTIGMTNSVMTISVTMIELTCGVRSILPKEVRVGLLLGSVLFCVCRVPCY